VAVEGSGRWTLATTVVTGERPPRGVDGGRSRLRVDISDCACQAGNQVEVDEKAAQTMTLLRLGAPASKLLCDGEVHPGSDGGWLLRCCCQSTNFSSFCYRRRVTGPRDGSSAAPTAMP